MRRSNCMQLMDCTLRDGANVVGKGFSAELTEMMIKGLIACGITIIEMGNALGVGAYDSGSVSPLTDEEYLEILRAYRDQAEISRYSSSVRGDTEPES